MEQYPMPPGEQPADSTGQGAQVPYPTPYFHPHAHPANPPYGYFPGPVVLAQPPRQTNPAGTSGLVISLLALMFAFIPLVGVIAWILAPIGLCLSVVGLFKSPQGLAIAGTVISSIALIICFAWLFLFLA